MSKHSPMFLLRDKNEMKKFYSNPTVIVSVIAFALVLLGLALPFYSQSGIGSTIEGFFSPIVNWPKVILMALMVILLSFAIGFFIAKKKYPDLKSFGQTFAKSWLFSLIAFAVIVLLLVLLRKVSGITIKELWEHSAFSTVVKITSILMIVCSVLVIVFSALFKNTVKLSGLLLALGCIMLVAVIFQFIYCLKGTEWAIANMQFFGLGGWIAILASLLVIGNEFYKLGWQGYNVVVEERVSEEEQAQIDAINEASMKAIEENNDNENEIIEENANDESETIEESKNDKE